MTRIALFLAAALLAPAVRAQAPETPKAPAAATAQATATIPVKGMHCGGCVATVTEALKKVPGVVDAKVNLEKEQAVVVYDKAKADEKKLVEAINATGYKAGVPAAN